MSATVTYEQAIGEAAQIFADARARRDSLPAHLAAAEAHVPGGPSVEALTELIEHMRDECRAERLQRERVSA